MGFAAKAIDLPLEQLAKWAAEEQDEDFYEGKRTGLLARGIGYIRLIELDGRSKMGVVVDLAAISQFRPVAQCSTERAEIDEFPRERLRN